MRVPALPSTAVELYKCAALTVIAIAACVVAAHQSPRVLTFGELVDAPRERRAELLRQLPVVRVHGGTVAVDAVATPVQLEQPVDVVITR